MPLPRFLRLLVFIAAGAAGLTSPAAQDDWVATAAHRIRRSEYDVTFQPESMIPGHPGGLQAVNRRQDLRAYFLPEGIDLIRRSSGAPSFAFHLSLREIRGAGGVEQVGPPPGLLPDGRFVHYSRGPIIESYENREEGIQATLELAGAAQGSAGQVVFDLATDLEPVAAADGSAVSFYRGGEAQIEIRLLRASESPGAEVPAKLTAQAGSLAIAYGPASGESSVQIHFALTGSGSALSGHGLSTTPDWMAEGDQSDASFGWSVSTAGDVNGDGFSDVVVSASQFDNGQTDEGRAYLYMGSATGLSPSPVWTAESDQAFAYFGSAVSTAGDVNGDGFADVIVGAQEYDNGQTDEGRVYLYLGSASGLQAAPSWTAEGNRTRAVFGSSLGAAGDVNGDGRGDVIIGAFKYRVENDNEGRAFVYLGTSSGLAASPVWMAHGGQFNAEYGIAVGTAGDVNADGYADIIVGALQHSNGQTNEGRVYVYHGSGSGPGVSAAWQYESDQAFAYLGFSAALAGDVNGDGYSDVIVGADQFDNGQSNEGRAFVFLGSGSGLASTPAWTAESNQVNGSMGKQVGTAGDVNGDGYADVVVGARSFDNGQTDEGRAFVYLGSASGLNSTPAWMAEGDQASARYAGSAATAGDVNGDGYGDLLVGANLHDGDLVDEGRAYLYLGSAKGLVAQAAAARESDQEADRFGVAAAAGDVNGDGFTDLVIGADQYDAGEVDEGRAFLFLGSAAGLETTPVWTAEGNEAGAAFGASVAAAGDINGDGFADIVVGAPGHDGGSADAGGVFIFAGSGSGPSAAAGWSIYGDQGGGALGFALAAAGDVNRDGYADIVLAAPGYDNGQRDEGKAYGYLGGPSGPAATPFWTFEGDQAGAGLGACVAAAGDVNRDGFSDLFVAAPAYDNTQTDEGRGYLFLGSPTGLGASAIWTQEGGQAYAGFGAAAATAGDVNGDGFSDLLVGAPLFDNGQPDEGRVYLYSGQPLGLTAAPTWTEESNQAGARLGAAVGSGGDVNGDGFRDVIVGAPGYDNGQADEGRVLLFYGSSWGPEGAPAWTTEGDQDGAAYGSVATFAGDINGDGFSDVIVTAPSFDNDEVDEGRSLLFYGNEGDGLDRAPRQYRSDHTSLISLLGTSESQTSMRLDATGRSPLGRARVRLEWEVKPLGVPFDGTGTSRGTFTDTGAPSSGGSFASLDEAVVWLQPGASLKWRLRVQTDSPYFPQSPWMSLPDNSVTETDARTAGCHDLDSDGYGSPPEAACLVGGFAADCDDASAAIYPGAPQTCDGLNNDCNAAGWPSLTGTNEFDDDGDMRKECEGDCDDASAAVFPGAPQVCDGINNDCASPGWPSLAGTNESDNDGDAFSTCQGDCDDADISAWTTPSEVRDLLLEHDSLTGITTLAWTQPASLGATSVRYDALRSSAPNDFQSGATCSESDDASDATYLEPDSPSLQGFFFYLIRAENACPLAAGVGPLGFSSSGMPISGRSCP